MKSLLIISLIVLALAVNVNSFKFQNVRFFKQVQNNNQPIADDCNITHFEFQNNYSLAKNEQLNRTFKAIGQKITALNNVTWKKNDSATFIIYQANPTFYYRDSKQKAEIVGNDSILIQGGKVQVNINFKWSKTGTNPKFGNASVIGLSDQIIFAKSIIIDGHFFRYSLLEYKNVTFTNSMNLTRISPADVAPEDRTDILSLVNNIMNVTTLRHQLQADVALLFAFYLSQNLHDESMPIDEHFEYKWTSPIASKGSLTIPFTRRPAFIDIERDGMHYGYQARIDNYSNWRCGQGAPTIPMNAKIYGGSQQFISYSFFENVARYAAQKGQLDTVLDKSRWESRMFQFYAGDLYEIFPKVAEQFVASTQVTGDCKANTTQIKVYKGSANTFNASLHASCQLNVNRTKILDFNVGFELEIQGRPSYNSLDFYLKSHSQFISYFEYAGWKMENKLLADQMVSHSLNRLYEEKLFGSGWPLHPERDYPHFEAEIDASFVYDSTHV